MNLLTAEAKRLSWRALVRGAALASVLGAVVMAVITSAPPRYLISEDAPPIHPSLMLDPYLYLGTIIACFAAGLIGATFIGAELSSGSLSQWLTFTPDRSKVYAAKLTVVAAGSALLGLVTSLTMLATAALSGWSTGRDLVVDASDPIAILLRGVALTVIAGVTGFALAALFGHTAAAPAGVAAWLMFSLGAGLFGFQSKLAVLAAPEFIIAAFLQGTYSRTFYVDHNTSETVMMTWPIALVIMTIVVGAIVAASWVRFARRDIA